WPWSNSASARYKTRAPVSSSRIRCGMPARDSGRGHLSTSGWAMAKAIKRGAGKSRRAGGVNAALRAVIDDLVVGNHILYDQDVVDGYGHISARDPRDPGRFLMSRARAPGLVTAADIMLFGLDGEVIGNDDRPVYSERFIHSEVYKARPDVHSVVSSHSPTVVPFTVTQVPLKPIRGPFLYPEVPVFDTRDVAGFTDLLISNPGLGRAVAQKLGRNSVLLLRGH